MRFINGRKAKINDYVCVGAAAHEWCEHSHACGLEQELPLRMQIGDGGGTVARFSRGDWSISIDQTFPVTSTERAE